MKKIVLGSILGIVVLLIIGVHTMAFSFPTEDDFSFNVEVEKSDLSINDTLEIHCTLTNNTNKDYDIEFGADIFRYDDEIISSIGQVGEFKSKEIKSRDIEIIASEKGSKDLTIIAEFDIVHSRTKEKQKYKYTEDIYFTVK